MKVLHVTNNFPSSQFPIFGIFIKEQIDSLTGLGIKNDVFFMNSREEGKRAYLKALIKLRTHLQNNNYDIIHCHHSYSAFISILTGKLTGKKCLVSYQSDPEKEGGRLLFRFLYKFFDRIILKNKSPEINRPKTIYLPNGVDLNLFIPRDKILCKRQLGLQENKRYIIFMDSYNRRPFKRIDRFSDTMKILKDQYHYDNLDSLILTNTERSLIPFYLCASDLHLLTSDFEGSPNSIKECLACNIPVVSTPVGNVKELLDNIEGCYVSKSFNPDELAELSSKALAGNHFSSRDSILMKDLDIKTVALKLFNVYQALLNAS